MSNIYEFYLPTITCQNCIGSILYAFESEEFKKTGIIIESHHTEHTQKEIKIKVKNNNKKKKRLEEFSVKQLKMLGLHALILLRSHHYQKPLCIREY